MQAGSDPFRWVGETVDGKYRVDALVGEGGFGVVYRAHHLGFGDNVAVKCLRVPDTLAGADRDRFFESFLDEGRLLHQLSRATAGIVQALDVGAATSPSGIWTPYLVLEWLNGCSLEADLQLRDDQGRGGRSLEDALDLLDPVARALSLAHEQGVAHRDVKPANLFLADVGGRPTVKVLDFGIAKVITETRSLTKAFEATGRSLQAFTAHYGAPEQFSRRFGATGPWTDVFALALVFVELVSGRRALEGEDAAELFVSAADPHVRPTLKSVGYEAPEAIEDVLRHALAIDPKERFTTMSEFWDALTDAAAATIGHQPPLASRPLAQPSSARQVAASTSSVLDADRALPPRRPAELEAPTQLATSSQVPLDAAAPRGSLTPSTRPTALAVGTAVLASTTLFALAAGAGYLLWRAEPANPAPPPPPPPSAPAPAPPPAPAPGPRPELVGVPAGSVNGTTRWLSEFRYARPSDDAGATVLEAHSRCENYGLSLCTESQWVRACSEHTELGTRGSWTLSAHPDGFVVRGGAGCSARSIASGEARSSERGGVCCERAVAVDTVNRNKTFLLATAQRLLVLESVQNQRQSAKLAEMIGDALTVNGKPTSRDAFVRAMEQSYKDFPDHFQVLDACVVEMESPVVVKPGKPGNSGKLAKLAKLAKPAKPAKPAKNRGKRESEKPRTVEHATWAAECSETRQRRGDTAGLTVRYVFAGSGEIQSIDDVGVTRHWAGQR